MDATQLTIVDAPERNDVQALDDGHFAFNVLSTGLRDVRLSHGVVFSLPS